MLKRGLAWAFLLTSLLLTACQVLGTSSGGRSVSNLRILPAPESQPAPTQSPALFLRASQPAAAETDDVLRFTFPTPGPEPVSLWRPPLYPVPWALGPFDHFYFVRPITADEVNWPLPDYRYGGIFTNTDVVHTGIDIPAPRGTPVQAAGSGKVVWAGYGLYLGKNDPNDPYGLAVTIRHDFGYQGLALYTVYAHLDCIDAVVGQRAEAGTPLGVVGTTGNTTGPHLHFEVRIENNSFFATRNPELWLAPPQGWGVLVGRMMNTNGSLLSRQDVTVLSLASGRKWTIISYGEQIVISDDYYRENLVLSDLPAGNYEIVIDYLEKRYTAEISIHPGAITYFSFRGEQGFELSPPTANDQAQRLLNFSHP